MSMLLYFAVPASSSTGKRNGPSHRVNASSPKRPRQQLNDCHQGRYYQYNLLSFEIINAEKDKYK